jgi:hypothetical protein
VSEHSPEQIREFLEESEPGGGIGVDLRDGRHLAGDFVSFDGETLRLELTFGRPAFTMLGGRRPDGPIVEIDFEEIARVVIRVVIEHVIEDELRAT